KKNVKSCSFLVPKVFKTGPYFPGKSQEIFPASRSFSQSRPATSAETVNNNFPDNFEDSIDIM
ncbi:MAG: hypothetical protein LUF00_11450, partial [Lachnospiraceae bacterium]|nr:hypothetical protein [Lachnospiraceae bacterium]